MGVFRHFGYEAREGPDVFNRTRLDTQRKQITFGQPADYDYVNAKAPGRFRATDSCADGHARTGPSARSQ
jgi:hypothetical protein